MGQERRIARNRKGQFELHLPDVERTILRALPGQLRAELAEPDAPDVRRLFPPATTDDEALNADYRGLVRDDLVRQRLAAADVLETTAGAKRLTEEQLQSWLSAVNDLRLILGTRLEVTDERQDEDLPEDDPRAQAYALYHYLGFLEEQIVEALSESLPA